MSSCPRKFVAVVLGFLASAPVVADECDQLPPPSVTLRRLPEKLSVDTRYGYREITHLAAEIARRERACSASRAARRRCVRRSDRRPLSNAHNAGVHEPAARRDLRPRSDDGLHRPRVSREKLRLQRDLRARASPCEDVPRPPRSDRERHRWKRYGVASPQAAPGAVRSETRRPCCNANSTIAGFPTSNARSEKSNRPRR